MAGGDYGNARIRAARARLLGEKGIQELLAQGGLAARLEYLKKTTDYGEAVAAHVAKETEPLRGVERGLRKRLTDDLVRIDRFFSGERVRSLLRAVLAFEDGWILKTILRGVARGEPAERILPLVSPTPGFDEPALGQLVRQKDVKGVVDLLATWKRPYAIPLTDAFPRYVAHREVLLLEVALDQFLFARALEAAGRGGEDGALLRRFLERQIDITNAGTLLKLAGVARGDEFFVPGGRVLSRKRFQRLSTLEGGPLREALARLGGLRLDPRLTAAAERSDPFTVDRILERALRQAAQREARENPLSLAVPLAFLLDRQADLRQIRLVLRGTEFGLPAEELLALTEQR